METFRSIISSSSRYHNITFWRPISSDYVRTSKSSGGMTRDKYVNDSFFRSLKTDFE